MMQVGAPTESLIERDGGQPELSFAPCSGPENGAPERRPKFLYRFERELRIARNAFPGTLMRQAGRDNAVGDQRRVDEPDLTARGDSHPELPVFGPDLRGVKEADLVENAATDESAGGVSDAIVDHDLTAELGSTGTHPLDPPAIGCRLPPPGVPGDHRRLWVSDQILELEPILVREPGVITVEKSDQIPRRFKYSPVPSAREAAVLLADTAHAEGPIGLDDLRGVVGGSVVDDDDLIHGSCLGQNALDGIGHECGPIVGGDDRADSTSGRHLDRRSCRIRSSPRREVFDENALDAGSSDCKKYANPPTRMAVLSGS